MAEALGAKFLDAQGQPLARGGGALDQLAQIDVSGLDERLQEVEFIVACDVTNPHVGSMAHQGCLDHKKGLLQRWLNSWMRICPIMQMW